MTSEVSSSQASSYSIEFFDNPRGTKVTCQTGKIHRPGTVLVSRLGHTWLRALNTEPRCGYTIMKYLDSVDRCCWPHAHLPIRFIASIYGPATKSLPIQCGRLHLSSSAFTAHRIAGAYNQLLKYLVGRYLQSPLPICCTSNLCYVMMTM